MVFTNFYFVRSDKFLYPQAREQFASTHEIAFEMFWEIKKDFFNPEAFTGVEKRVNNCRLLFTLPISDVLVNHCADGTDEGVVSGKVYDFLLDLVKTIYLSFTYYRQWALGRTDCSAPRTFKDSFMACIVEGNRFARYESFANMVARHGYRTMVTFFQSVAFPHRYARSRDAVLSFARTRDTSLYFEVRDEYSNFSSWDMTCKLFDFFMESIDQERLAAIARGITVPFNRRREMSRYDDFGNLRRACCAPNDEEEFRHHKFWSDDCIVVGGEVKCIEYPRWRIEENTGAIVLDGCTSEKQWRAQLLLFERVADGFKTTPITQVFSSGINQMTTIRVSGIFHLPSKFAAYVIWCHKTWVIINPNELFVPIVNGSALDYPPFRMPETEPVPYRISDFSFATDIIVDNKCYSVEVYDAKAVPGFKGC